MYTQVKPAGFFIFISAVLIFFFQNPAWAAVYEARSIKEISELLQKLQPGDTLEIGPGKYAGGIPIDNLNGTKNAPVTIMGKDPKNPPVFMGGNTGFNLSRCNHVHLRNLKIQGAGQNGMNIHDGNTGSGITRPSTNILVDNLVIEDTGPVGNHDALKMSGVRHFVIQNCKFLGWGGSGIDFVGCSSGKVTRCYFKGKNGFSQANGVQIKGGSHHILVEKSFFIHAGRRGINLGGSTGYKWFRPAVGNYEAKNIEVGGNVFYGSTPISFVTSQLGFVHHNAFLYPSGWVIRILQESEDPRFLPCGNSVFMKNIVVVNQRLKDFLNIGRGTNPRSFMFIENLWYDAFAARKPTLPSIEKAPVYKVDPKITIKNGRVIYQSNDPRLIGKGPAYYRSKK